jgi:hypothetical protein
MHLSPPRQSLEHALLSEAARKKRLDASIAVLADAVQDGRTTAGRLLEALADRPKLRHHRMLGDVLADVGDGVRSVLEHRYLKAVELAHGLPRGERQRPWVLGGKRGWPDVEYKDLKVLVHLDGKVGHSDALDRWADFERDLAGFVDSVITIRIGWRQVLDPCRLAGSVAALLKQRGWKGHLRECGPICTAISTPGVEFAVQTR